MTKTIPTTNGPLIVVGTSNNNNNMLHSCHYVVLDGTWRRRNKCASHESMPIYQQKKKNQLLNYNLVEIICLVLVGIPTFITHDNIADWTSFFVCVHFFLIDFQCQLAWCFLCWGTKHRRTHRRTAHSGAARECNDAHRIWRPRPRWEKGRAAPQMG